MVSSSPFFLLPTCLSVAALASCCALLLPTTSSAFQLPSASIRSNIIARYAAVAKNNIDFPDEDGLHNHNQLPINKNNNAVISRRSAIATTILSSLVVSGSTVVSALEAPPDLQKYEDFTSTSEGWSYKDVKIGKDVGGGDLKDGDRVVFDWSGYTIGYFGRPFEAKGGPQGGAFDKDLTYFRTTLGSKTLVPGVECALRNMKPGGIRQVIVPYGPLSYPVEDMEHELVGPKPTTFSGMRALNFVLENPRVDRTLLFNVKLIRVDRSDGKGGFIRGEKAD